MAKRKPIKQGPTKAAKGLEAAMGQTLPMTPSVDPMTRLYANPTDEENF